MTTCLAPWWGSQATEGQLGAAGQQEREGASPNCSSSFHNKQATWLRQQQPGVEKGKGNHWGGSGIQWVRAGSQDAWVHSVLGEDWGAGKTSCLDSFPTLGRFGVRGARTSGFSPWVGIRSWGGRKPGFFPQLGGGEWAGEPRHLSSLPTLPFHSPTPTSDSPSLLLPFLLLLGLGRGCSLLGVWAADGDPPTHNLWLHEAPSPLGRAHATAWG